LEDQESSALLVHRVD